MPKPAIYCNSVTPALQVGDVMGTVDYYTTKLGFTLGFTWGEPVTFAGVMLDQVGLHFAQGSPRTDGLQIDFVVEDVNSLYEFHRSNDVQIADDIDDREWGMRTYSILDCNGYAIGFGQHTFTMGDPIDIERVDVTMRIEKRLAALLHDLAEHKRMTIGQTIEETLLHTFEPVTGEGVASPHTRSDFAVIRNLRTRHGIDYDVHGNYRFREKNG